MKSHEEVKRRLEKLKSRYFRQFCVDIRSRKPCNCVYNYEHRPTLVKPDVPTEYEIFPRVVSTTLVVQDRAETIGICTFGSENCETWNGDICDSVDVAQRCKNFQAKISEDGMRKQFDSLMSDDKYVYENYKDIAALQWVTGERVHAYELSWLDGFFLWLDRVFKRPKLLPEHVEDDLDSLWDEKPGDDV